mmetsp:Transcript_94/g.314  ORF Transcript_94/g.314 Transcript_94/m.314 type:complete len:217 (-) Transcript_94:121-771(-)
MEKPHSLVGALSHAPPALSRGLRQHLRDLVERQAVQRRKGAMNVRAATNARVNLAELGRLLLHRAVQRSDLALEPLLVFLHHRPRLAVRPPHERVTEAHPMLGRRRRRRPLPLHPPQTRHGLSRVLAPRVQLDHLPPLSEHFLREPLDSRHPRQHRARRRLRRGRRRGPRCRRCVQRRPDRGRRLPAAAGGRALALVARLLAVVVRVRRRPNVIPL